MAYFRQVQNRRILNKRSSVLGYKMSLWIILLTFTLCFGKGNCLDYCKNITGCRCTDEDVTCDSANLQDITRLFHYIKDHVENITITGDNLIELPQNTLGSCRHDPSLQLPDLVKLDLSSNNIERIHGTSFHCMPNLEILILRDNNWRNDLHDKQIGYFTSLPNLKHLDLTNAFEEVWNGSIHMTKLSSIFKKTDMTVLETLKLGDNEFFSFSIEAANTLCELTHLKSLNLSHNNFESPSLPTIPDCLEKLETLDLSHNKMKRLPNEFLDKVSNLRALKSVKLGGNLFNCDCGLVDTWHWLNKTKIVTDKSEIVCKDGFHSSYVDKPVLSIQPVELMCTKLEPPSNTAAKVVIGLIFAVIGLTIAAFLIVNRDKVKLVFKRWSKRMPKVNFRSRTGYKSVQEVAFVENV